MMKQKAEQDVECKQKVAQYYQKQQTGSDILSRTGKNDAIGGVNNYGNMSTWFFNGSKYENW